MPFSSIRRYDVQATYAMIFSLVGVPTCLAAGVFLIHRYDYKMGQIVYGSKGMFVPVLAVCLALSLLPAFVGFLFGLSSAGQRRNDKQSRSWIGFFVGGLVCTLDVIMVLAFVLLRLELMT